MIRFVYIVCHPIQPNTGTKCSYMNGTTCWLYKDVETKSSMREADRTTTVDQNTFQLCTLKNTKPNQNVKGYQR